MHNYCSQKTTDVKQYSTWIGKADRGHGPQGTVNDFSIVKVVDARIFCRVGLVAQTKDSEAASLSESSLRDSRLLVGVVKELT